MAATSVPADALSHHLRQRPRCAVLFTAAWCGPCVRFKPHFEAAALPGWEKVVVDVSDEDHDGDGWDRYHLRVVPTVAFFRDATEIHRIAGVLRAPDLDEALGRLTQG